MTARVLFAAGGTGGHILPALAVAGELRSSIPNLETLFIGSRSGLEAKLVPQAGYSMEFIFAKGLRRRNIAARILSFASLSVGFFQALGAIARFRPHIVYGSGGYASAATILAAATLRRTIVLQEQNSIPGLANRVLSRFARRIYMGFENSRKFFGSHRGLVFTGNPLRPEIECCRYPDARSHFGLDRDRPVVLVFGGSQGARRLNHAAVEYLLNRPLIQAIVQTGEQDYGWVREKIGEAPSRIYVAPYIAEMHLAYAASDVALARAGALSVSELAAVALPSVLVPYPFAADDHQRSNASFLADAGGAVILKDEELSPEKLAEILDALLADGERLAAMRKALSSISKVGAARAIAEDMARILAEKRSRTGERM